MRHRDRKNEPKTSGSLGPPPRSWPLKGRNLWHELRAQIPEGVATASDKASFELLCLLMGHVRANSTDVAPAMAAQLRCALSMFGMSPSSRAALTVPPPPRDDDDDAAEFFTD